MLLSNDEIPSPPQKKFMILFRIWFEMYFGIPCDTHLEILQYMY